MKNLITEELAAIKKWGPVITESQNITDKARISWMSQYAHNHATYEKSVGGFVTESAAGYTHTNPNATIMGMGNGVLPNGNNLGSGDSPMSLLPVALQVAAQTVGFDLVRVVPMPSFMGMLTYLDFVYNGGNITTNSKSLDGTTQGGASPYMVKLGTGAADGAVFADQYWRLTKIGVSRIDGKDIYVVEGAHTIGVAPSVVSGEFVASTSLFAPGVEVNGHPLYASMATLTGATALVSGELTTPFATKTPELVQALLDHIPNFSGDLLNGDAYTRGEGEVTAMRDMSLKLFTKSYKAKTIQVSATVTQEQLDDIKAATGINVIPQILSILTNELSQTINREILARIESLGAKNFTQSANKFSRLFYNATTAPAPVPVYVKQYEYDAEGEVVTTTSVNLMAPGKYTAVNVGGGAETLGTTQRRILSAILNAKNHIAVVGRRGAANKVVTSGRIGTAIQDSIGFNAYPIENSGVSQSTDRVYSLGKIAGLDVYVDPMKPFESEVVSVIRQGGKEEPGLVFCPYILAHSVQTITDSTLSPKIGMKSRYAIVEAGFYPELTTVTFAIQCANGVDIV